MCDSFLLCVLVSVVVAVGGLPHLVMGQLNCPRSPGADEMGQLNCPRSPAHRRGILGALRVQVLILTVVVVDDLEILDGGLCDSAVEVEHVGLSVVVPHGRLVVELNDAFCVLVLPSCQQ